MEEGSKMKERIIDVKGSEDLVLRLLKEFSESEYSPTKRDIRVAGGWPRDKLLGIPCNDLDIVLEDVTGEAFATPFRKWLNESGKIARVQTMVVRANPDKSKHLETAIMDLPALGLSIDFVNLRSENYSADSRVPNHVEFGSPLSDALRRDFTINALFYNLNTSEIEDYTTQGLSDLESFTLRTPLPTKQTFLDDPLRVIRAARFLGKLPQMVPDPLLEAGAGDADVINALRDKVAIDRVRQELGKVFSYSQPERVLETLRKWNVLSVILPTSKNFTAAAKYTSIFTQGMSKTDLDNLTCSLGSKVVAVVAEILRSDSTVLSQLFSSDNIVWTPKTFNTFDQAGALYFTALLIDDLQWSAKIGKNVVTAIEDRLENMRSKSTSQQTLALGSLCMAFYKWIERPTRDKVSEILRFIGAGRWWEFALMLASIVKIIEGNAKRQEDSPRRERLRDESMNLMRELREKILKEFALNGLWNVKPAISGRDLHTLLPQLKSGPKFGEVMKFQVDWIAQNWHDDGTVDVPQLQTAIVQQFQELL